MAANDMVADVGEHGTTENRADVDGHNAGAALSSVFPSRGRLLLFALLVPAAVAGSNQLMFDRIATHQWPPFWFYPWMAISAAALSWCAGRYLYPAFFRWILFAWCLALLDVLTFTACLGNTQEEQFGYMLVSAQVNLLVLWTILGPGGWQWRLPIVVALAPAVIVFGGSIGSDSWFRGTQWYGRGSWFSQSWTIVVTLTAVVTALLCFGLRWFGFVLKPSTASESVSSQDPALGINQFGLKHMLIWATAIVPLLLVARGLDFLVFAKLRQNEFFPTALLSMSLATVSLVSIWVVLGAGRWYLRLPALFIAPLLMAVVLETYSDIKRGQFGNWPRYKSPIIDVFIEMGGIWFGWVWQGTALLAALLLFLRASGYRLARTSHNS